MLPLCANTDASTAIPNTPPTSRSTALLTPDALPSSCGLTAPSTTFATGAKKNPFPIPLTSRPP